MPTAGTIVLPIAGRSSRFPGLRPKWMLAAPTGELMLEHSLRSVPDWKRHRVVIGGLREHLEDLHGMTAIRRALGDGPEFVVFDEQTSGPAETVAGILRRADVAGPIFIKDCDSWFEPVDDVFGDVVCFADLRTLPRVSNIAAKSFVSLNENALVSGIFEKSISSNFICIGGYGFREAHVFLDAYRMLLSDTEGGETFVSHVILEAMRMGAVFRGVEGRNYHDVGTLQAWNEFRNDRRAYFVDLDGVVFRNAGQYIPPLWDDPDIALPRNVEALRRMAHAGAQIVFVTARPERYREKTERSLRDLGLAWHAIVFGVNHSGRVLINDYAPSNAYPSAVAMNVVRNDDSLDQLLQPRA